MYRRDGQRMRDREEGAAFFQPISLVPPRTMGIDMNLERRGFAGLGQADVAPEPVVTETPSVYEDKRAWAALAAGAALGFFLIKRRK